tara:strand:- start:767 stop:1036 length:270 start_codon:yes stop_codon:yes gene_type:complete
VTLYNRYILVMALIFCITSVILAVAAVSNLGLGLTIYIIESLLLTELFIYLNPKAKRNLSRVNVILFALFLVLLASKVLEILLGVKLLF